jgi:signal transduction histidine kinase
LRARVAELTAAVAARDAFLAVAAHELRNPMTPIIGYVQRLRRIVQNEASSRAEIDQAAARIEWLIGLYVKRATTLLDVSRITTGKLRVETAAFDLSELVRTIVAGLEPASQHAGSTLSVTLPDGLIVHSDRLALEQILDNLILNAIKYGAGKPIHISITTRREWFDIKVTDHGIGMSEQDRARIFQPFERAIAYGTQAGFGVGLWVVRELVDAMKGTIRVESTPGAGTTFTVALPRTDAPA